MQFEPNRAHQFLGYSAGFLFSWLLAATIVTTIFTFMHGTMNLWKETFVYFFIVILIIIAIGIGIKRALQ